MYIHEMHRYRCAEHMTSDFIGVHVLDTSPWDNNPPVGACLAQPRVHRAQFDCSFYTKPDQSSWKKWAKLRVGLFFLVQCICQIICSLFGEFVIAEQRGE